MTLQSATKDSASWFKLLGSGLLWLMIISSLRVSWSSETRLKLLFGASLTPIEPLKDGFTIGLLDSSSWVLVLEPPGVVDNP